MEKILENQTQERLTRHEAKAKAWENMVEGATFNAVANGWTGLGSYKAAFKADPEVKIKNERVFPKWMVKNISRYATFNIVKGLITYKVLPPYGEEGVPINNTEFINF